MEYQTQTQDKVSMAYLPFTNFPCRLTGVWLDLNCRFMCNELLTKRSDESSNNVGEATWIERMRMKYGWSKQK